MNPLQNRKALLALGAGLGAVLALAIAVWLVVRPRDDPPSGPGSLTVVTGLDDSPALAPDHPLKCFVNGQEVGLLPLKDCAQRNGVDTGALDVGLDAQGDLGASNGLTSALTPLPPRGEEADAVVGDSISPPASDQAAVQTPAADATGPCWRYGDGGWSRLPDDTPLAMCVQALFAGQCEPPGAVAYGRWRGRTLRLVTGRVEISADNRVFHLFAPQGADCSIPSLGD